MPENLEISIKSFHINSHDKNSFVDVLVSSPSPVQKRTLGKLIIITQVNSEIQTKNLVNIINENIRSNYYSNINANIEFSLETTLADFNKKIKEIEKIEKIKDLKSKLSTCVIVIKDTSVYFTQHGDISSLLLHKAKIINIIEDNAIESDSEKIFSDIVIGKIAKGSTLLFSTNSLFDYTEPEKISNHLENSTVENTVEFVKKSLDAKEEISYGIGFVLIGEKKLLEEEIVIDEEEGISYEEKDNIEQNIIPQLSGSLNKPLGFFKDVSNFISSKFKSLSENKKLNDFIKDTKKNSKEAIVKISEKSKENIKKGKDGIFRNLKTFFVSLPSTIGAATEKAKKIQEEIKKETFKERVTRYWNNTKAWFKELTLAKKIVFVSIIVVIFTSIFAYRIWQQKEITKIAENEYQETLQSIKSIQNEATSSLLYNNVPKAKELISNAEYLISNLKTDSKTRQDNKTQLEEDNKTILNKVYKIINIVNPTVLSDLSSSDQTSSTNINKIFFMKNALYAFDYKNKGIYNINISNKSLAKVSSDVSFNEIKAANIVSSESGNMLFIDSNSKMYTFDGTTVTPIELKDKYQTELNKYSISDINSYSQTLYLLDTNKQDILTIKKGTKEYGNVYSWLKSSWDFKDVTSMTIDGYIYTAKSNGLVEKFYRGYNRAFNLDEITPKLQNIVKTYTDENTDNIYVLDATEKRFVVFNKNTGALVGQYISPSFDKLKDFYVDIKAAKAYILNDNKIFEISL